MEIVCGKATDYMELWMNWLWTTHILVCHDLHNPEFKIHNTHVSIFPSLLFSVVVIIDAPVIFFFFLLLN
jgi:hypothetical protein